MKKLSDFKNMFRTFAFKNYVLAMMDRKKMNYKQVIGSLDILPDDLVLSISDYCDLESMEALSTVSRRTFRLIRIRPLSITGSHFTLLENEMNFVMGRIERIQADAKWGEKLCGAFIGRYRDDERIVSAKKIVSDEVGPNTTRYWRLRRIIDLLLLYTTNKGKEFRPYFLYFWDDRDGQNWEGWWITSDYIGNTRHYCFSAGGDAQEPYDCRAWNMPVTLKIFKEKYGTSVLVKDTALLGSVSYEGYYKRISSTTHCHGNRHVYKRTRGINRMDNNFIISQQSEWHQGNESHRAIDQSSLT